MGDLCVRCRAVPWAGCWGSGRVREASRVPGRREAEGEEFSAAGRRVFGVKAKSCRFPKASQRYRRKTLPEAISLRLNAENPSYCAGELFGKRQVFIRAPGTPPAVQLKLILGALWGLTWLAGLMVSEVPWRA
jgi:hypothetical protein